MKTVEEYARQLKDGKMSAALIFVLIRAEFISWFACGVGRWEKWEAQTIEASKIFVESGKLTEKQWEKMIKNEKIVSLMAEYLLQCQINDKMEAVKKQAAAM